MIKKNRNCTTTWPCSRSEVLEVLDNIGSGKCTCTVQNKSKAGILWLKLMSIFY